MKKKINTKASNSISFNSTNNKKTYLLHLWITIQLGHLKFNWYADNKSFRQVSWILQNILKETFKILIRDNLARARKLQIWGFFTQGKNSARTIFGTIHVSVFEKFAVCEGIIYPSPLGIFTEKQSHHQSTFLFGLCRVERVWEINVRETISQIVIKLDSEMN